MAIQKEGGRRIMLSVVIKKGLMENTKFFRASLCAPARDSCGKDAKRSDIGHAEKRLFFVENLFGGDFAFCPAWPIASPE
ncbi:MAG: hypothetical protein QM786_09030 [Breznakibacter sp.]